MTSPSPIETANLLTILGVIAAIWALISPTGRLRFRYCVSWLDWTFASAVFLLIHYLAFGPALESAGLYYSLGTWKWGLDSSSVIYLLLLLVVIYFFWRTRAPTLARGKLNLFRELVENLLLTQRYDELVLLVEPQLQKLIGLSTSQPLLVRLTNRLRLRSKFDLNALSSGTQRRAETAWQRRFRASLKAAESWLIRRNKTSTQASELILDLVTSSSLVTQLAVTHPYFHLKLLMTQEAIRSDLIDRYMDALLAEPGSRLFVELKNSQNIRIGSRLGIPQYNRLLRFFFADAAGAIAGGLDKAIGEAVLVRLDEDDKLAEKLNRPLGSYYEVGKFRCPINSGITLFEIMVHEGIHQGLQDHMWLHYFPYFVEKILVHMQEPGEEDAYQEWPTPFHYLLYRMVLIATEWAEQCSRIDDAEIPKETRDAEGFDRHFISKQATMAIDSMLRCLIPSPKISSAFKEYLLGIVIRSYVSIQGDNKLADVASSFLSSVISGSAIPTSEAYRRSLLSTFEELDHVLRIKAEQFEKSLSESLVPNT